MTWLSVRSMCFLALAVACGSGSSGGGAGGNGGASGGGAAGADGGMGGGNTGGTAALGGGGVGAAQDPAYCPPKPYEEPEEALTNGSPLALTWGHSVGNELSDGVSSAAPLPGGDVAVLLWRLDPGGERAVVQRLKPDGSLLWEHLWPNAFGQPPVLGGDSAGNVFVAGVAAEPFDVAGVSIGTSADGGSTTFLYVLELDVAGALAMSKAFPLQGLVHLNAMDVSGSGDVALVGDLWKSIDFVGNVLAVPPFMDDKLSAAFAVRLSAQGDYVWGRVFPATGVHGDPPPLAGQGGTDGLGHSSTTDVAWAPDDSVVITINFVGAIDLQSAVLPNDGDPDGLVAKLGTTGATVWLRHMHGLMGEVLPPVAGAGGIGGQILAGSVRPGRLDVNDQGRIAWTGGLSSRAQLEGIALESDNWGHFSALLEGDGKVASAVSDGGIDVAFIASGSTIVWDGTTLFQLEPDGNIPWSLAPGGTLLGMTPGCLASSDAGVVLAGSFFGKLDLGAITLESAGCADGVVARFGP